MYLPCAKSCADQGIASLQSHRSPSASTLSFICTDVRQVTGRSEAGVSAGGGEERASKEGGSLS